MVTSKSAYCVLTPGGDVYPEVLEPAEGLVKATKITPGRGGLGPRLPGCSPWTDVIKFDDHIEYEDLVSAVAGSAEAKYGYDRGRVQGKPMEGQMVLLEAAGGDMGALPEGQV